MFAAVFAAIIVFDEIITFALSSYFGRGGGAGVWFLLVSCMVAGRLRIGKFTLAVLAPAALLLILSIRTLELSAFYLMALTLTTLLVCTSRLDLPLGGTRSFLVALAAVLAARALSALGIDVFEIASDTETNRPTGLYSEPSHLAYYVAILYLLAVLSRPQDRGRAALLALACLVSSFSASAFLPLVIVMIDTYKHSRHRMTFIIFSAAFTVALLAYRWDYLLERALFAGEDSVSLTVQVLIYYYQLLATHLSTIPLAGFGFDRFKDAYDFYSSTLGLMHDDLNSSDGSFLAVKVAVENGLPFALLLVSAVFMRLRAAGAVAAGLLMAQFVFLRGFGLTSSVVVALMLIAAFRASLQREQRHGKPAVQVSMRRGRTHAPRHGPILSPI